jgi:hypothetical protein
LRLAVATDRNRPVEQNERGVWDRREGKGQGLGRRRGGDLGRRGGG